MSITDELREWGSRWEDAVAREVSEIADRIDERYHRDMATAQQVGINEGEDAAMRDGWVRLPVDADGEVIHRGDVMVKPDGYDNRLFIVNGMTLYGDQWSVQGFAPHNLRHDHPTVEDVLEELLREYDRDDSELTNGEIIERFAAKLRLAGDDE